MFLLALLVIFAFLVFTTFFLQIPHRQTATAYQLCRTFFCFHLLSDSTTSSKSPSGKTTAYAIPLLNYAAVHGTGSCTTLVVAPSRELASQIHRVFQAIAEFAKLKIVALLGGVSVLKNMKEAQSGALLLNLHHSLPPFFLVVFPH